MVTIGGGGRTPNYTKVMGFFDGSNLLIELSKEIGITKFRADKPHFSAISLAYELTKSIFQRTGNILIRKYWFASYQGDDAYGELYAKKLRRYGFEPCLYKKTDGKEKGVDIGLATEMLVNAFNQNYDLGIIVAGDKDYVQLVKEVKRYGPIIHGAFLKRGLSDDLKLALDLFLDIIAKGDLRNNTHAKKLIKDFPKNKKNMEG